MCVFWSLWMDGACILAGRWIRSLLYRPWHRCQHYRRRRRRPRNKKSRRSRDDGLGYSRDFFRREQVPTKRNIGRPDSRSADKLPEAFFGREYPSGCHGTWQRGWWKRSRGERERSRAETETARTGRAKVSSRILSPQPMSFATNGS